MKKDRCSECWNEFPIEDLMNEDGALYCPTCLDEFQREQELEED